ncbi:MAG: Hsp20/alpha crystallin family protein [Candidatus Parcubacteria bacterium]|nr:Hsp20/alpha crystallin family protein [Candidatus Parcubacteria bacterium]
MFSKFKTNANEKKPSFFQRITGVTLDEEEQATPAFRDFTIAPPDYSESSLDESEEEKNSEGQLAVDIYQTDTDIYIQTMPAGVKAEDLTISITPETVVISGLRERSHNIESENYLLQELYWGSFSRTIELPEEVDPSEADAIEKHGLLIIKLPKVDKTKQHRLKVRSS